MKALILAAGYGTRLYPIIKDKPKALLPIHNKPLIDFIVEKISHLKNLDEIYVVSNNKFANQLKDWTTKYQSQKFKISIVNDQTNTPEDRLGSIGDIDFVIKNVKMDDDLLVIGGDNLFTYGLDDFIAFAGKNSPSATIGLYDIKDISETKKFGVVELGPSGKLKSFQEKPESAKSTLISMCLYYFPKAGLNFVDQYIKSGHKPDKAGEYIQWLMKQGDVYGFQFDGKWYDIGSVESLREAEKEFPK